MHIMILYYAENRKIASSSFTFFVNQKQLPTWQGLFKKSLH